MQPDLPITLAEWPRNSREMVRVRLDLYSGQVVVDCRSWWREADGLRTHSPCSNGGGSDALPNEGAHRVHTVHVTQCTREDRPHEPVIKGWPRS